MRAQASLHLALLALVLPAVNAITLSQFQPIDGFSTACVNAYNTPLSGCTALDFSRGDCSVACIKFLDALTSVLNAVCTGSSAYPNTLVGAFFQGEGTSTLCPNILGGGSTSGEAAGSSVTDGTRTSTSAKSTDKSTTSTIIATTSVRAAVSSTMSDTATTTSEVIIKATVMPNSPLSTITTEMPGSKLSTSTSSSSASTSSSGGGGGNGGGTILDVGSSSACHNARIEAWALSLLVGSAGLVWFL